MNLINVVECYKVVDWVRWFGVVVLIFLERKTWAFLMLSGCGGNGLVQFVDGGGWMLWCFCFLR